VGFGADLSGASDFCGHAYITTTIRKSADSADMTVFLFFSFLTTCYFTFLAGHSPNRYVLHVKICLRMARKQNTPKTGRNQMTKMERYLPWLLVIAGTIAMIASTMLAIEVFNRLKNPNFVPVCNLNPILSCTSVADSHQAHAFGFPNYFIGIAGYAAVTAIGVAILAGGRFKRWLWQLVEAGLLLAMAFLTWLQYQTLYRIGALCLFCMIVWAATIPSFWYVTLYNFREGNISTPKWARRTVNFAQRHHGDIVILWFLIIIALILKRFWYYWSTLI
jgi:uncharacterized membrane protein